jgi:hypothetical protein
MPESAFATIGRVERFDLDPLRPDNRRHDELSDSISALHTKNLAPAIHQNDLNFTAVVGIDRPRTIRDEYAMSQSQSAARTNLGLESRWERNAPPGGNQTAFSNWNENWLGQRGAKVEPCRCLS